MEIVKCEYDDLSKIEKGNVPNNGCGKENADYIRIIHNGETVGLYSDAMEPEDAKFCRDLDWIIPALKLCYKLGMKKGAK